MLMPRPGLDICNSEERALPFCLVRGKCAPLGLLGCSLLWGFLCEHSWRSLDLEAGETEPRPRSERKELAEHQGVRPRRKPDRKEL